MFDISLFSIFKGSGVWVFGFRFFVFPLFPFPLFFSAGVQRPHKNFLLASD